MDDQEVDAFEEWGEAYKELSLHKFFEAGHILPPEKMEMFFNSTYDLDKLRDFVFRSTLLERFEVDEDFVHQIKTDDEALLRFGFLWARFALFGEPTMRMRPEAAEAIQEKLDKKRLSEKEKADSSQEEAK